MRQKLLILALSLSFISNSFSQQGCTPSDACNAAPFLSCYYGYINTTAGYTAGSEPINCPNGQGWAVHNDQWFKFIPTQATLTINIDVIGNCDFSTGVQALIHESCDTNPIDCDVDCSGNPSVGAGITFIPGNTYFLRIDGCSGAKCPIQITVDPPSAITSKNEPLAPNLTNIIGNDIIPCSSENGYYYSAVPLNICATTYNWIIESGNAVFTNLDYRVIDNDPNHPGKNISIVGNSNNNVRVKFLESGIVKISVIGTNGCQFTNKISKYISVKKVQNQNLDIAICPNVSAYENDSLPGGPFPPGFPCGTIEKYDILSVDKNGCEYTTKLSVKQQCDTVFNLGEIILCPNEKFIVGDYEFDSTLKGHHEVIVKAKPNQNANLNPPRCDSTKIFYLIPSQVNYNIYPINYSMPCSNSKITLNAKKSTWSPNDTFNLNSVTHQWQRYYPAPGNGWQNIAGANADTLLVDEPSRYRLITTLNIKYKDGLGKFNDKLCSSISKEINVTAPDTVPLQFPKYNVESFGCVGIPYHLKIENPDPNLQYTWVKIPQNDTIVGTELTLDMNSSYQIVGLLAKSDCEESIIRYDTIYNISENPVAENIDFQGSFSGCLSKEYGLKLINFDNYKLSTISNDSVSYRTKNDSIYLTFKYPGTYQIDLNVSNTCNSKTIIKQFNIDESIRNFYIQGAKLVIEKSTNLYCINNPNLLVNWSVSKNLKYKYYNANQNCIAVTFPKGISTGWIKSTAHNYCSDKSDSILVFSKPKLLFDGIEDFNIEDDSLAERSNQSEIIPFQVVPNPAINSIEIKGVNSFDEIECIDILGKANRIKNEKNIFDISNFNSGFYIIKLYSNRKEIGKSTFIKIN